MSPHQLIDLAGKRIDLGPCESNEVGAARKYVVDLDFRQRHATVVAEAPWQIVADDTLAHRQCGGDGVLLDCFMHLLAPAAAAHSLHQQGCRGQEGEEAFEFACQYRLEDAHVVNDVQRCLDEAVAYTKERQQFGQPIADFQNTQFMLADMATELEAARALLYLAAAKVTDNAPDKSRFSAMAKRLATDSGSNVVNNALQLFGGYGYLKEYPIERFWRDLRVHSILEGTNQVMRMIVGRDMLRQ